MPRRRRHLNRPAVPTLIQVILCRPVMSNFGRHIIPRPPRPPRHYAPAPIWTAESGYAPCIWHHASRRTSLRVNSGNPPFSQNTPTKLSRRFPTWKRGHRVPAARRAVFTLLPTSTERKLDEALLTP